MATERMAILNELNNRKIKNTYKAPEKTSVKSGNVSIFLAGSIEMDKAEKWQDKITKQIHDKFSNVTVFNPRRDDWDSSWIQELTDENFYGQVDWEHEHIVESNIVFIYFQPDTKSPISLMELGLCAVLGKTSSLTPIVCCPKGFWRKGNVDYICKKYDIQQIDKLDDLIDTLAKDKRIKPIGE